MHLSYCLGEQNSDNEILNIGKEVLSTLKDIASQLVQEAWEALNGYCLLTSLSFHRTLHVLQQCRNTVSETCAAVSE